jgi:hypothetical protein
MLRSLYSVGALALALFSPGSMVATAHPASHLIIYSSLCIEAESGDVAGYQIPIDVSASPPSVSFGWGEGGLMEPVRASAVFYDRRSGVVRFDADANGRLVSFSGRISGLRLGGTLTWIDNPGDEPRRERVHLQRVHTLDLQPPCK